MEPLPGRGENAEGALEVVSEGVQYKRFLNVFNRTVKYPATSKDAEKTVDFDLVGHPRCGFKFAVVFPFHPAPLENASDRPAGVRGKVTLIKEYCQGVNAMSWALPTGGYDPKKHKNIADCAASELSEEAHLRGGELVSLIPSGHPGIPESKWCLNRFTPFIVINPEADPSPSARDTEEIIEVAQVDLSELKSLMYSGQMMAPSIITCAAALEYLSKDSLIPLPS